METEDLHLAGYKEFKGLYLEERKFASTESFKANVRKQIIDQGYDVILNIDDQSNYYNEKYADKTIIIPETCYFCS
jgi:hypothetical protein